MSRLPVAARRCTEAEYFELLASSEEKWEFFDGEVFPREAMAGTTNEHAAIAGNIQSELRERLKAKKSRCTPLGSDALLPIPRLRRYRYPDLTVLCGPAGRDGSRRIGLTNPTVLMEVVSDSSREADYGVKFRQYTRIPTLRDYVAVEQDFPLVTVYSRADADAPWVTAKYFAPGDEVLFASVDVTVPIEEIYRDIAWMDAGAELQPGAGPAVIAADEDDADGDDGVGEVYKAPA